MADERPAFQAINDLFARHGLSAPPWKLRDELATHLMSHRCQPEAREGEAVAWIEAGDLEHVSEGHPLTTTLFPYAKGDADLALYTHPAAPSADKLRIAVEAIIERVKTGAQGSSVQALGALSDIEQMAIAALKAEAK